LVRSIGLAMVEVGGSKPSGPTKIDVSHYLPKSAPATVDPNARFRVKYFFGAMALANGCASSRQFYNYSKYIDDNQFDEASTLWRDYTNKSSFNTGERVEAEQEDTACAMARNLAAEASSLAELELARAKIEFFSINMLRRVTSYG